MSIGRAYIVMTCIIAYVVMAYTDTAYEVVVCIVMACIAIAYTVVACIVMAYIAIAWVLHS